MSDSTTSPGLSLPAKVVIGALALFGALAVVQWLVGALFGLIRLALLVALVVGVAGLVLWGGPDRDD